MNKYSSMSDDELNREIAGRLGYTFESRWIGKDKDVLEFSVRHPEGYLLQEASWNEALDCWRDTAEDVLAICSDWADDLNMAINLLKQVPPVGIHPKFWLEYLQIDEGWLATVRGKGMKRFEAFASPDNPARAICEAWLLWKDSQS